MANSVLRLEQVGVLHRLESVSCEIFRGDRIGIVGASGAGKSTLLQLLNRLSEPDQGTIWQDQQPLGSLPIHPLRRRTVLVLQEPKLLGMTVAEALAYPLTLQQKSDSEIQAALNHWCDRLRIPCAWYERHEYELSVGQRQLVTLARALLLEPEILLLDEPTSALDVGTATQVFQVLQELPQLTWLMVNHQLDWVKQYCDRLLWLEQGRLRQDCPIAQVDWPELEAALRQSAQEWGDDEP
ncbi:MAG: ATP-binding cassette domain-containing protein [Spirulina sp. SIO3F2]|nr:ATP-binding cassette domain-containing protein [Spirulina sp. SIO3F2]